MSQSDQKISKKFLLRFTPERWGQVDRFLNFYSTTHRFNKRTNACVSGVVSHFYKALTLQSLANRLRPSLAQDNEQLESEGYTPASHARELSAVLETILCELYASIDCTATLLSAIYGKLPGVPSKSTRNLFTNAVQGKFDDRFPRPLLDATMQAEPWVAKLRDIRDTVSHSAPGSCFLDSETGVVRYMNAAMGPPDRAHIIDDIFTEIEQYFSSVNEWLGATFLFLNSELEDIETQQVCGFFSGRVYTRLARPSEATSFHGGRCKAHLWFEKEENPACPLVEECGAYKNKVPPDENE